MKICFAMLAALALLGCSTLEHQQIAFEGLRQEVQGLSGHLRQVEQSMADMAREVREFEHSVDGRLGELDEALARPIEIPPPVCEFPPASPLDVVESVCESVVEQVVSGDTDKTVVGAVERIRITPPGIVVNARVDTGADSSSISATNLVYFERDGDDWVRFDLTTDDEIHRLEREVLRFVRVFQQSSVEGDRRPMVRLRVEFGDIQGDFEFNLSDRRHLRLPVILGRNLLMDLVIVDVAEEYLNPLQE